MAESGSLRTLLDGIWSNNPGLVQFLGLCPLLAVTNTAINGLGLGLATLAVLVLSNCWSRCAETLFRTKCDCRYLY